MGFLGLGNITFAAFTSGFTTNETQVNIVAGVNNQSAVTDDTTTPNIVSVTEVKASQILTVNSLPANNDTITIGSCVVTFADNAGIGNNSAFTDSINCSLNVANISNYTLANPGVARTPTQIANVLDTLTNVSDVAHGTLTVAADITTTTKFSTTGTESSASNITFTDGTAGKIINVAVTGVIPVTAQAQINTITIGGTIEVGDIFIVNLPTVGNVSFTAADTVANNVAAGLNSAIFGSSGYASQAFTSGVSANIISLTAKIAGTGFTQTSSTTNKPAVAQVVDFIPSTPTAGETFRADLNGTNYDYTVVGTKTVANVTAALQTSMSADSATTCVDNTTKVTCTANTPGTAFTSFLASIVDITLTFNKLRYFHT